MRKLYILLLCLSFSTLHSSLVRAANITWIGGTGGNWSDPSNWSPASTPAAGDNVTFSSSVTVNMNGLTINVASLKVTGNSNVIFSSNANAEFDVSAATNALVIDNGSSLKVYTAGDNDLHFQLLSGSSGVVNGTFYMEGAIALFNAVLGSTITINPGATLAVNGTVRTNANAGVVDATPSTISFNAGSNYIHNMDGGIIPMATWDATSTIQLLGTVNSLPSFGGSSVTLGNLIVNAPNVSSTLQNVYFLAIPDQSVIQGNFQVVNFSNLTLCLFDNQGNPNNSATVNKNFTLGSNSIVQVGSANGLTENYNYTLQVNGDYTQTGGTFSLQGDNFVTGTSKLAIKGNFNQSGGTFGATSTSTSTLANLFVLEFNGSAAQNITTNTNTIDNANNQVALRMNNSSGGVTLQSQLSAGRLDLTSGVLTTNVANSLAINSTDNTWGVINGSNSSYIDGPITRKTNSTAIYTFPTGKNGFYRKIDVIPSTTTSSSYTANYFRVANGSPVANPLTKISNTEYWSLGRVSGSDAVVQLWLAGLPVNGAAANSVLVVASYDGTQWQSALGANGTTISPGNSVNGSAKSDVLSSFNLFTFGVVGGDPLPIKLLDFTATKSGSSANLKWTVDPVDIPQTVEILKSNNGRDFTKVGSVPGVEGVASYNYTDALGDGNNYYRLRLIDKDGSVLYSKVAAILNQVNGFAITGFAPTLVTRSVKLSVSSGSGGTMDLYITDMSGKIWRKFGVQLSTGNNEQQLDLSDLSGGVYQVIGVMNGQKTDVIRFVKQ